MFNIRSNKLRSHRGEVCFPGGRRNKNPDFEDGLEPIERAALREAYEEIGLNPNDVEIIGRTPGTPDRQWISLKWDDTTMPFSLMTHNLRVISNEP